jgi:hypothetical protein
VLWIVRGRLVDWGPLPGHGELVERTKAALAHPPGRTVVPVDEVDEIRIVASWIADNEPPELPLEPEPSAPALMHFAASALGEVDAQERAGRERDPEPVGAGIEGHVGVEL